MEKLKFKIVYLTPEKLVKSQALMNTLERIYKAGNISRFVIDEVHCLSHWGQHFRKDYLNLYVLKEKFKKVPILSLTATATVKVKEDIVDRLGINKNGQEVVYF